MRGNLSNRISHVETNSDHLTRPVKEHSDPGPSAFRPKNFYFPTGSTMKLILPTHLLLSLSHMKTENSLSTPWFLLFILPPYLLYYHTNQLSAKAFILSVKNNSLILSPNHQTQIASLHALISLSFLALRMQLNCLNCPRPYRVDRFLERGGAEARREEGRWS